MKTVQIEIKYHGEDEQAAQVDIVMTEDELRALTRHLSSIRVSDVELGACLAVRELYEACKILCHKITHPNGERHARKV